MYFTSETRAEGVIERDFTLGDITGVLWTPETPAENAPLILMGHSGGMHNRAPGILARATRYASEFGFSVAAIDAPGHGDRPRNAKDQAWVDAMMAARAAGESIVPVVTEYNTDLALRAVPEWQATITALQAELGDIPIGYGGVTLGTATGLLLTATDPRIKAASFGSVLLFDALTEAARQITIPVQLLAAWDDEEIPRAYALTLFDAFNTPHKTLHANPGRHNQTPWHEVETTAHFFTRHLTALNPLA
ncbi:alpha/beta hydrolase [Actinomadura rupiterrae]|uniref:alpha/beta hydrolase n=1 Tax=Actinomadura rupiterrae TaxID=559627 RepID=UPI0020A26787|nr:alpha/beta hydrolase [Actinomadura rupiterrae]MCP2342999.1 pimeloyl-ACP methyl ester carboxylesterase [Actinomadura rupiterrae]